MVYFKRNKWCAKANGRLYKFDTKEEALRAIGKKDPVSALDALRKKAPVYKSFEAAVEDHGKDEGDFAEED